VDVAQCLGEPREISVFLICVIVDYHMRIVFSAFAILTIGIKSVLEIHEARSMVQEGELSRCRRRKLSRKSSVLPMQC
jgi:hypothetical protein